MTNEADHGTKTIKLSKAEIDAMTPEEFNQALMKAVKIEGTVVVRDKDGNIKYDNPELAGTYHEENL